jgi:hypothetical protein
MSGKLANAQQLRANRPVIGLGPQVFGFLRETSPKKSRHTLRQPETQSQTVLIVSHSKQTTGTFRARHTLKAGQRVFA